MVARKRGAAAVPKEEEPEEVEEARGELKGFLDCRAASKAAQTRAEGNVSAWEAELASLREEGAEEERIRWVEANLRKANLKVAGGDRGFRSGGEAEREGVGGSGGEGEGRGGDELVEVDVQGAMEEASVKEEEEEETKVVEAAPAGGGGGVSQWLRGLIGSRAAGAIEDVPWDPTVLAGPQPPNLDSPLLVDLESPVWTIRFLLVRVHHRLLGAGRRVWVDKGGGVSPPGQAPAPGAGRGVVGVAT